MVLGSSIVTTRMYNVYPFTSVSIQLTERIPVCRVFTVWSL